jgi:GT2 family glycosyltransferase
VSVSVVSYRSRRHLAACLDAVFAQGSSVGEVLLVDNDSRDGSVELVRERHPSVSVLALGSNLGFAAAHNRNFARARGEFFLALNPDVVLAPGCLERLVAALRREPDAGAASGRLLRPGPGRRLDSAGIRWAPGRTRFVDRGVGEPAGRFSREEDVFGACGAAALYRVSALDGVARPGEAPFAERFFMYYEDVDLAWRLRRAGWRTRYVPDAEACHVRGGSGAANAFIEYHLVRNRLWVSLRNASAAELLRELPGLALFETVKAVQALRRPHLRAALRDQWRGVRPSLRERRLAAAGGPT